MVAIMKRTLIAAIMLLIMFATSLAEAQALTPPDVTILGPVICSAGDSATNVKIVSPQNKSHSNNPVQLIFSVQAVGMFGQFGNVGYCLDSGGIINSVNNLG